jgi:hypothetical protein
MRYKEYVRLARARSRQKGFATIVAPRSSLWLGKDHLLNIDSMRFTEEYKRFYFRDIQAITIRQTKRRAIWNVALMLFLFVWLAVLFYVLATLPDNLMVGLMAAWFLVIAMALLANNLLGPTCAVYLRTAVQIEELPSLSRVQRAHEVLERIRPLIAAAQGQLAPEDISVRLRELTDGKGA